MLVSGNVEKPPPKVTRYNQADNSVLAFLSTVHTSDAYGYHCSATTRALYDPRSTGRRTRDTRSLLCVRHVPGADSICEQVRMVPPLRRSGCSYDPTLDCSCCVQVRASCESHASVDQHASQHATSTAYRAIVFALYPVASQELVYSCGSESVTAATRESYRWQWR